MFQITGDVIRFDGYDAARINPELPASVRGEFNEAFAASNTLEPSTISEAVLAEARKRLVAGFISLAELENIFKTVEDGPDGLLKRLARR